VITRPWQQPTGHVEPGLEPAHIPDKRTFGAAVEHGSLYHAPSAFGTAGEHFPGFPPSDGTSPAHSGSEFPFGRLQSVVQQHRKRRDDQATLNDESQIVRLQTGNDHFAEGFRRDR